MNEQIAPQNLEAEASVIGGVLIDNTALARAADVLAPVDFYREAHRTIFAGMLELAERDQPVDVLILSDLLKAQGELEHIGGTAYLTQLADYTPTAANIVYHARLVRETSRRRALVDLGRELRQGAYKQEDVDELTSRIASRLFAHGASKDRGFQSIEQVVFEATKEMQKAYDTADGITGIPTGLNLVDECLGGLARGVVILVAGRPGMGKTAFGGTVAINAAKRGYCVAFVTAESPNREIVLRMLSAYTGIENRNLRRGKLLDRDFPIIQARGVELAKLPLYFLDRQRSWDAIKAKVRGLHQRQKVDLVVIDYVQLLTAPTGNRERYLEVGRISSEAKELAVELDAALILLAQLNRELENRPDKRPRMSDLRESGNLEQDADIIGFLYRPIKYDLNADRHFAELNIDKFRNGATGGINLRYTEETTWFSDWID